MSIPKQTRQEAAAKRQQEKHLSDTMATRAEAEIKQETDKSAISEQAREGVTAQRQQEEHIQGTMLSRTQAEINDREAANE